MSALSVNKREKKQNGLSRMENPKETLATLGTYDTGRRQTKHRKLRRLAQRTTRQAIGEHRCSRMVSSSSLS